MNGEKCYVVPQGMLEVGYDAWMIYGDYPAHDPARKKVVEQMLERVIKWLAENPIVPTEEQIEEMGIKLRPVHPYWGNIVAEWQRRMFLAPEPEVPEALKDLLWEPYTPEAPTVESQQLTADLHNNGIYEAYRRGLNTPGGAYK